TLAPLVCGLMHARLYGIDGYRDENHWCRAACLTLPGCAHVEESKAPVLQPAPPPHFVPPRPEQTELLPHKREPAKPELMTSDAACQEDADCLVEEHRSCCGCQELRVRAKGPAPREPECGCADFSARQLFGGGGPCGPMPPPVGAFRARCVKHRCAGVPVQ
ncbi:MAG: hypothetical protein JST92_27280, partial [Deltaproteobacteria bacterium]|nr:hypothetical protein [Deltaproteobacteria bacterium]